MDLNYKNKSLDQSLATDADEVEITALQLGSSTIDAGIQDELIANAMDDFYHEGNEPDWVERDVASDSATSGIYKELLRRVDILGEAYPFVVKGNAVTPKSGANLLTYTFCLITSYQKNITQHPFVELPRTFELLATKYSQAHFGSFSESMHTGWPRQPGAPRAFKALADEINRQTGEWFWQPQAGLVDDDSNHIKDGGIDFISWVKSPDNRLGKLFIVGQCACGNDWTTKFDDINFDKLDMWFNPVSCVPPVKAFCTPYALVDGYLFEASRLAGLVYDRFRLAKLSQSAESTLPVEILDSMRHCIDLVLED